MRMVWILHSILEAHCTELMLCNTDGNFTTSLMVRQRFQALGPPSHSTLGLLLASQLGFQCCFRCRHSLTSQVNGAQVALTPMQCVVTVVMLLQVQASRHTVERLLQFLKDGGFLDTLSSHLHGRFITYNNAQKTFSSVDFTLSRSTTGSFQGQV